MTPGSLTLWIKILNLVLDDNESRLFDLLACAAGEKKIKIVTKN